MKINQESVLNTIIVEKINIFREQRLLFRSLFKQFLVNHEYLSIAYETCCCHKISFLLEENT